MKPILAALLCLTACRAHFEEQVQRDEHAQSETDADRVVDKHVVDAPDKTTTTIEEFANDRSVSAQSAGDARRGDGRADGHVGGGVVGLPHGPLVKRTVIVAEHGAVVTDTHVDAKSQERADTVVDEKRRTEKTTDFLHSPFALLGGLVALAAAAYVAWRIFKPVVP